MKRRSMCIPDDLWKRIQRAAAILGAKEGKPISVSEWIRRAILRVLG